MKARLLAAAALASLVAAVIVLPAAARSHQAAATTVKVLAGKPSEFKFALSTKTVHRGTVTFLVTNKGKITHNFKIAGKKTPNLAPGKSAKLVVKFAKAGKYAYLCAVPGHAAAGMKGVLVAK